MKKKLWLTLCSIALLLYSSRTRGDIPAIEVINDIQKPIELSPKKVDFYALPLEKRIENLEERKKKTSSLSEEEKAEHTLQTRETILLTVHNMVEDGLGTVRGMVAAILPNSPLSKVPLGKLADFVYLFDKTFRDIVADREAYRANLKTLTQVTRCMLPRKKTPQSSKDDKKKKESSTSSNKCEEYNCSSKKKCMAIALNCTVVALKPFSKVFAEGVDINGQHIQNGLVIMGDIMLPLIATDEEKRPKIIQDFEKLGFILKSTITFFAKTRDMFIASADKTSESIDAQPTGQKTPDAIPITPQSKASPAFDKIQGIINKVGLIANVADKFAQGLGSGLAGTLASSCVYSVVNFANMSTDIITLMRTDMLDKTFKRFECLLKDKKELRSMATAYKGNPGDDKTCPSLGCIDLPTCHALTMVSLATIIRPFIENFIGKAQLDSSGNPTGKIEMGLFMNIGNAISEILNFLTSLKSETKESTASGYRKKMQPMLAPLLNLKDLIDKARELEILLAGVLPQLIEAFEQTALDINPETAKYVAMRTAQRKRSTEELAPELFDDTVDKTQIDEEQNQEKAAIPKEFDDATFSEKNLQETFDALKKEMKGSENEVFI